MIEMRTSRSQLAVMALIWMIGAGLWFAPPGMVSSVRGTVRDLLVPGQRGVQNVSDRVAAACRDRQSEIVRGDRQRIDELEREAALWRQRALRLHIRSAELARELDRVDDVDDPFPVAATEPLLLNRLIEARTLGSARSDLERRLRPIIDRGSAYQVDVDDIVLAEERLHLDQGDESGLIPDSIVLSGVQVVGRIEEVGRWTSTIQPVTDEEFRGVAQLVRDGSSGPVFGAPGILAGNGDGTCRLELIAAADPVSVGDTVFLPGHRTGLPGSAYYGRVVEATLVDTADYWSITVEPRIDLENGVRLQVLLETVNPRRLARDDGSHQQSRVH